MKLLLLILVLCTIAEGKLRPKPLHKNKLKPKPLHRAHTLKSPYANGCVDTNNGATDAYGDGCLEYNSFPGWCGLTFEAGGFDSSAQCCVCGGGAVAAAVPCDPECQDGEVCKDDGTCVQCTDGTHCTDPAKPTCDSTSNTCVPCTADSECTGNENGEVCKDGLCVQCTDDTHCTDPAKPYCKPKGLWTNPADWKCQPCAFPDVGCVDGVLCNYIMDEERLACRVQTTDDDGVVRYVLYSTLLQTPASVLKAAYQAKGECPAINCQ